MNIEMPERIAKLPVDEKGRPVPWFVAWIDGKPDFRVADGDKVPKAIKESLCWICGEPLGRFKAFLIGPMCAVNHVSSEPPSHKDCAIYSAQACPFLATPKMHRRERDLPADYAEPAGLFLRRNPGVALIWITTGFRVLGLQGDGNGGSRPGILFQIGDAVQTLWYCEGREATKEEITESIESGLPLLREAALSSPEPEESMAALDRQVKRTMAMIGA
jgi:hypothetical protein